MAKLIDHNSVPSTKTELDLFSLPPTQVSIESGFWFAARLVNTCTSNGPWRFHVQADPHFLDLSKNYLYAKVRVTRQNGGVLVNPAEGVQADGGAAGDFNVRPINLLGKTMFKQTRVYLNSKLAFDSGPDYAYRAFLETDLNYGSEAKSTQLTASLYHKDRPPNHLEDEQNVGFMERAETFRQSAVVEFMAPLHCDLFNCEKLLLPNTEIQVELFRNPDPFLLIGFHDNVNYKLEVQDMAWYVRKVNVLNSVHMGLEAALQHHTAKYPVRRIQISKLHVAPGRRSTPTNNLFTGQLPRRIVFGFIDSDAYFGNYQKSPFRFKNYSITQVKIVAGGQTYPREPIVCDFPNNQYVRPYIQLFESLGLSKENIGNYITPKDFKESHCLFCFDLFPDEQDGSHWELLHEGSLSIDVQFGADVPNPGIELICYAEYDNLVTIDRNRNVNFDFSV